MLRKFGISIILVSKYAFKVGGTPVYHAVVNVLNLEVAT